MMAHGKGTVTSLSSLFPADEARKASQRVQESIAEKHTELDKLHHFVDDNTNLINLVQRLPDELHHHIMVPFGKAAFFPGRLVHTNELLVLLGEGYFAERTAKQTVDILGRRGKILDSQVDSLKAVIEDLKTEASFFERTASEAAEGLVEIREEYTEEDEDSGESEEKSDAPTVSELGSGTGVLDDEEYARIMSRFDELEKEELEAEDTEDQDDDKHDEDLHDLDQNHSKGSSQGKQLSDAYSSNDTDKLINRNMVSQPRHSDESSDKDLQQTHSGQVTGKDYVPSIIKRHLQPVSKSNSKDSVLMPKPDAGNQMSRPVTDNLDSLKAFTGSIIERTDNLQINPVKETTSQPSSSQPAKPVSRFKMQRRGVS